MNPPKPPNTQGLVERLGVLTATVDQLQAEHDRDRLIVNFLTFAIGALAGLMIVHHRQILTELK